MQTSRNRRSRKRRRSNLFDSFLTYLITKGNLTEDNFQGDSKKALKIIACAADAGISLIQIREKNLSARLVFEVTNSALELVYGSETRILVNDRFDIALAAGADGVHLTSRSIPTEVVRKSVGDEFLIGVSTHSFGGAEKAKKGGADFVTYSPIFETNSKYKAPKGVEKLRRICADLKGFPIVALGGINSENYESVLEAGAAGFAGISFFNNKANLRALETDVKIK